MNLVADIVINATYSYSNSLLNIFGLEEDMTEYVLQKTEIPVVRSEKPLPSLTVMDGDFLSIMQTGDDRDLFLIYDVIYSIVEEERGFFLNKRKEYPTNYEKMLNHGEKYFPFIRGLEHVHSIYGARSVPVGTSGARRTTRIKAHKNFPGLYSILEGKFISAPLMAQKVIKQLQGDGILP